MPGPGGGGPERETGKPVLARGIGFASWNPRRSRCNARARKITQETAIAFAWVTNDARRIAKGGKKTMNKALGARAGIYSINRTDSQ